METDCVISHGASAVAQNRLLWTSNPFPVSSAASVDVAMAPAPTKTTRASSRPMSPIRSSAYCKNCSTGEHTRELTIPYSFKLLSDKIAALGIVMRLKLSDVTPSFNRVTV